MFEGVIKQYTTVNSVETVEMLLEHIENHEIIAYDTEDTGLNFRKDKVIGFSICGEAGISFYMPIWKWDLEQEKLVELEIAGKPCTQLAKKILKKLHGKKLLMHNGNYDILITKNSLGVDLLEDLYCETILLIHTVQEEGVGRGGAETFGLKKVAIAIQDKIGLDIERAANEEQIELKASINANGGMTTHECYEIFKADLDVLCKYAAADTDLTFRIFHYYSEILKNEELEKFFYSDEVMPVYREVTIPMVEHGIAVDIPLLEQTSKELTEELNRRKDIVIKALLKEEAGQRWVLDNAVKSFPCKKTGQWGALFVERYALPLPKTSKGYSVSRAAIDKLDLKPEDEWQREFLLTGNQDLVPEKERVRISLQLWKDFNKGDYFNVQSSKQLGEVIFNYFGEKPPVQKEDSDQDTFDMQVIEILSKKYEWLEDLRVYRRLNKIKTTYVDRFLEKSEDGRYYFYWKQHGTISGRFASDAQQLPKPMEEGQDVPIIMHYNHLVRRFLIAGPGRKFVDADYESLEPHCFASVSGDEGLRDIFRHGWDFYSTIAIRTEKLDEDKKKYPDGVSPDKESPIFLKKLDPVARQKAKGYALGVPYGMSGFALGKRLGISTKAGQALVDGYLNGFPQLKEWYNGTRQRLYKDGKITNFVGRVRHLNKGKEIYDAFGEEFLKYDYREEIVKQLIDSGMDKKQAEQEVLSLYMDFKNARNNALNYQLQSLGADVVNRAALAIIRKAKELGIDAYVTAQIHDQIIINCEESRAEELRPWMEKLMSETTILPGVELLAPAEIGDNMAQTH